MTITIGSVTLNDHISWTNRSANGVAGSETATLGGKISVLRMPGNTSLITLEAIEEDNIRKGYFTQAQYEALQVYRDVGSAIDLNYHNEIHNVIIPIDGLDNLKKTLWNSQNEVTDRYIGQINLRRTGL